MAMILICSLFTTSLANLFSSWPESKIGLGNNNNYSSSRNSCGLNLNEAKQSCVC